MQYMEYMLWHLNICPLNYAEGRASLVSKHLSTLLTIVSKQLLRHEFVQSSHTMEAITTAMDQVPEVVRKVSPLGCLVI
jgi:hypothetical protein